MLSKSLGVHSWLYSIPEDDLIGEVIMPAMREAASVRVAAGFFSSKCLTQIAPGLAHFVCAQRGPIQLMMSPHVSVEDRDAIERGACRPSEVLESAIAQMMVDAARVEDALIQHTLDCLSLLVAQGRIHIKVVVMRAGQYHKKLWLFECGSEALLVHGSGNATERGMLVNGEQMSIDASWTGERTSRSRISKVRDTWLREWENDTEHCVAIDAERAIPFFAVRDVSQLSPTDFERACAAVDPQATLSQARTGPARLSIPAGLRWQDGLYAHQAEAINAWDTAGGRGILEMATGSGKTNTAMIAATRLATRYRPRPTLVLITAPSRPLSNQWAQDVSRFGVNPILIGDSTPVERKRALSMAYHQVVGVARNDVVVISTNATLLKPEVLGMLRQVRQDAPDVQVMHIADEVHSLGAQGLTLTLNDASSLVTAVMGLSATPIRQYDQVGTERIYQYVGPSVFEFGLSRAIGSCLVPYRYSVKFADLNDDELAEFAELSRRIGRLAAINANGGDTEDQLSQLYIRRREIGECAIGKDEVLRRLVFEGKVQPGPPTIVFTSSKDPDQLRRVVELLDGAGWNVAKVTEEETAQHRRYRAILERFRAGSLDAIVAKRVLDEGVDLPEVRRAVMMASSSTEREWIQRRGRVLRRCEGKSEAEIIDVCALPPRWALRELPGSQSYVAGELERMRSFAQFATNAAQIVNELTRYQSRYFGGA